mgnify:CR=1 FL=1
MYKRTVSGIMLILLLTGLFSLAINVMPAKSTWTGTVYIRADGSIDPPDAPIQRDGNVYTLTDNITSSGDGIVVERDNIIIDGAGYTVGGTRAFESKGIYVMPWKSNITIKNMIIEDFHYCIYLAYAQQITISNNDIKARCPDFGIFLENSDNSAIVANRISGGGVAVVLKFSCYNSIEWNNITGSWGGIDVIDYSNDNYIANNTLNSVKLAGIEVGDFSSRNYVANNTIIGDSMFGIRVTSGRDNHILRNVIAECTYGMQIFTDNTNIINNIVAHNTYYAVLLCGSECNISNNMLINNWDGIFLYEAQRTTIENNVISQSIRVGIALNGSDYNNIIRNKIDGSKGFDGGGDGIWLVNSDNNDVEGNLMTQNKRFGIAVRDSYWNVLSNNIIALNGEYGIWLYMSHYNQIYHNDFIKNQIQQAYSNDSFNYWDNGYPSGGNYWSDYTGLDADEDGIGDTPYVIDENNIDHYPLMNPYAITPPVPSVIIATVDVNPKTLNLRSRGKWITTYIELPEGYDVGDINVSSILLDDTISANLSAPIAVGDYDNDTVPDLMVCFNWTEVAEYVLSTGIVYGNVTLEISGKLYNGTIFTGTDTILVSSLVGDVNVDGKVDIGDLSLAAMAFGSYPNHPRWNPNANFNQNYEIDIMDIALTAQNYGKHA